MFYRRPYIYLYYISLHSLAGLIWAFFIAETSALPQSVARTQPVVKSQTFPFTSHTHTSCVLNRGKRTPPYTALLFDNRITKHSLLCEYPCVHCATMCPIPCPSSTSIYLTKSCAKKPSTDAAQRSISCALNPRKAARSCWRTMNVDFGIACDNTCPCTYSIWRESVLFDCDTKLYMPVAVFIARTC